MAHEITTPQTDVSFPQLEAETLKRWRTDDTFGASLRQTRNGKRFTFYDGPPFATGLPHYGHLLAGTVKDVIPRYQTMRGRYVERRFGWDCHGLPVEYELEKELGIKNRQEILEMGVGKFNEACRGIVLRYAKEWEKTTNRLGRWVDFENDYKTMDPDYMESIWWVVKQLWDKGLLYEGRRSMHICPRCATPLSNFEVGLGYADRTDPSVYVKFPLADGRKLVAWTTTPWTLPGNVLLAVNPKLAYIQVTHGGEELIVVDSRVEATFPDGKYQVGKKLTASELVGLRYEPPFPIEDLEGTAYQVVADDAVTADEGTGILHVAPAFGEDDLRIGQREQAPVVQHIALTGEVIAPAPEKYRGTQALETNSGIVGDLKHAGRLLRKESVSHSYPHCWRCDTPLLNYAAKSWFVAVEKIREKLLETNQRINWVPDHVKQGRFGHGLQEAPDWSISRNRFWGNPLPIWKCPDGHVIVVGSREELKRLSGKAPDDLHKQFVDQISFDCPECGGTAERIEDVLDCWFESGSMPYAQLHYPFEHEQEFSERFPADFISEGLDQTRGWFYTLHVLAGALKDSPAYRNVLLTGLVMAEDGKKMSKRLKNYPEPSEMFDRFGADAVRLYLLGSPIVRGDNLNFSAKGVEEMQRTFSSTLYHAYVFFATYAAVDGWAPGKPAKPTHLLDRWITSALASTRDEVTQALEEYDLMLATRSVLDFLDDLSNWYVRRSRRRFWKSEDDADKAAAYRTLYDVLVAFTRLAAPLAPFLTDHVHRQLTGESVHLADWPAGGRVDEPLEARMQAAREVVSLGLAARSQASIKVRQPLREAKIVDRSKTGLSKDKELVRLVADELNVRDVTFTTERDGFVTRVAHPVPSVIGPAAGADAQTVITAVKSGEYEVTKTGVTVAGRRLPPEAVEISFEPTGEYVVEGNRRAVVGLDTTLDQGLRDEGRARELIRRFQELRKASGLAVSDRIEATVSTDDADLERAIDAHRDLIAQEILARSLEQGAAAGDNKQSVDIDGAAATIALRKA